MTPEGGAELGGLPKACYCLFCKAGQESRVMAMLRQQGMEPLSPQAVRRTVGDRGEQRSRARLLPGYVFFECAGAPNWPDILRFSSVLRVLQYADGARALRGEDLRFVAWLKRYEGLIDVSEVIKVGTRIAFVSGPLVGMETRVLQVNKSRRQVQIAVGAGEGTLFQAVWCPIEYVQAHTDSDTLRRQEPPLA